VTAVVPWRRAPAAARLLAALGAGAVVCAGAAPAVGWRTAGLLCWVVVATVFVGGTWLSLWPLDAESAGELAVREDGSRTASHLSLVAVSVGTLATVALVILRAHENPPERTALAVICVAASWLVVNTVFALRYARLYCTAPVGGVAFPGGAAPTYRDFAYLAVTVGMTFQVSDTALESTELRMTALGHALMAFVFDVIVIAVVVNVVAGLSS
jgi:uncharacterized membrane protein